MAQSLLGSDGGLTRLMECAVCMEIVNNHRCLPCQHVFCQDCLQPLLGPDRSLSCPVCREVCHIKGQDVSSLPRNLLLVGLLEKLCTGCRSGTKDVHCSHCARWLCTKCHESCKTDINEERKATREEARALLRTTGDHHEQIMKRTLELHSRMVELSNLVDSRAEEMIKQIRKQQNELKEDVRKIAAGERDRLTKLYSTMEEDASKLEVIQRAASTDSPGDGGEDKDLGLLHTQNKDWKEQMRQVKSRRDEVSICNFVFQSSNVDPKNVRLGEVKVNLQ